MQASFLALELEKHWTGTKKHIDTTINKSTVEGLDYKYSNLDASVILAVLHTQDNSLSFGIQDSRIQSTFLELHKSFKEIYSINQDGSESVGIGRYPEDTYYAGNPWFLLTHAFAEYLFELADHYKKSGSINVDATNRDFMEKFAKIDNDVTNIKVDEPEFDKAISNLLAQAHLYINKSKRHSDPSGQMDEQFDRNNGYMKSARHLTWSYASFITMYLSLIHI